MRVGFNWWGGVTWKFKGLPRPYSRYRRGLTIVYAPAIVNKNLRYGAGMSFGGGGGAAIVLHTKSEAPHKMFLATLHEVLHTLGAHDESCGVDNSDSTNIMCYKSVQTPEDDYDLLWLSVANKRRIKRTLRRMRRRRRNG